MQKRFRVIFILIISLCYFGCREKQNPCLLSKEVLKNIETLDSLTKSEEIKLHDIRWMKNNYNEPSLLESKTETYRYLWDSPFDGTEIYRIEEINGRYKLIKKVFSSHQDSIGVTTEFEIQKKDWDKLVNGLRAYNFWTYPYTTDREVLDGTTWVLEAYKPIKDECTKKNYHRIGQYSPIDTTFIAMCNLLRKLKEK